MKKKYKCHICGQIVEVEPGESCPICGASFDYLEEEDEEAKEE